MTPNAAYAAFLAARWDEEEGGAWHPALCDYPDDAPRCTCPEVVARRAVLEACEGWDAELDSAGELALTVLTALAEPFRTHPDHPANAAPAPRKPTTGKEPR